MKCNSVFECDNDGEGIHQCPYQEEIYDNHEPYCNCCEECEHECRMEI